MKTVDRQILRLALPSIVSNITVPLLGLCDVTVMGHVGGAASIGAIAVGSMIFNVMYWLFVFLRMSTGGLTAQAYGACRWGVCRAVLHRSLTLALVFGGVIVVLQVPLQWLAFWLFQAEGDVAVSCLHYYYICVWGAPAVLGLYVLTGWLVGMQDTRMPMLIAIGQNVINIGLSLLLVVGFGMGINGLAIGTLTAQWAGFLMGLAVVLQTVKTIAPSSSAQNPAPNNSTIKSMPSGGIQKKTRSDEEPKAGRSKVSGANSRLNLNIFLRTLCLVSVNLYFTSAGSAQGPLVLAANTLLMQLFLLYSYVMDGFANAGEALSGRYLGAADGAMLSRTVRHLFVWGAGVAAVFTIVYLVAGPLILRLLTSDAAVVDTATIYLPWAVLIPIAGMGAFVWDGIFIGTTRSRGMLVSCFWASAAFFVLWFMLSPRLVNHALWIAMLAYLALRGLLQTILWNMRSSPQETLSKRSGERTLG